MSAYYAAVEGNGNTITCDNCDTIVEVWWTEGSHAICNNCANTRGI